MIFRRSSHQRPRGKMVLSPAAGRILMCRPTHFKVSYSINPWMKVERAVDSRRAGQQWTRLKEVLEAAGARVLVMEPEGGKSLPDLVFTANAAVIRGRHAYLAHFAYKERKGERPLYRRWFESAGFACHGDEEVPFEGAGDALWTGAGWRELVCGVGPRSDPRAVSRVVDVLTAKTGESLSALPVRLVDPRFYHLDTAFCPLTPESALWFPGAFDAEAHKQLRARLDLVPVSEEEATRFACNAVVVEPPAAGGKRTVVLNAACEATAKQLEKLGGFRAVLVDMSEFIKSGGSSKCCTLALDPAPAPPAR